MQQLVVAFTGHRLAKFGGYHDHLKHRCVLTTLISVLAAIKPAKCISGMAIGFDQWGAHACIKLGIPFIAAVPFDGQEGRWPATAQQEYRHLLTLTESVEVVFPGGYAAWKMHRRNEWMVDRCSLVLAAWDGSSGGTANCVAYAAQVEKPVIRLDVFRW